MPKQDVPIEPYLVDLPYSQLEKKTLATRVISQLHGLGIRSLVHARPMRIGQELPSSAPRRQEWYSDLAAEYFLNFLNISGR